jgi:3-phosphoshikimate 1-carboxyvinyltransferase
VSSQFVSALMLLGPCLEGGLNLHLEGELVSRPYVEMTARVMSDFGAVVTVDDAHISVPAGAYRPTRYTVEPDFSSAAFPLLSLAHGHGTVRVPSLASARLQGDSVVLELLGRMGISVREDGGDIVAHRPYGGPVRGVDVDLRDASDLVPALAVAACAASGVTRITGIGFIRGKESDRIADLVEGLRMLGAQATAHDDGISVTGGRVRSTGTLRTHHDHRLAMAFSMVAAGGHTVLLDDGDVVSKSWPGYFEAMKDVLGPVVVED